MHLHDAAPAELATRLTLDDADALLTSHAVRTPAIRIARDGKVLPSSAYTRSAAIAGQPLSGLVDARKALGLFEEGATIVFQGLHRYWPPLTELIGRLELELGHPCQANAYLTPPAAQGFAVHSDSHDVFVFQTHGEKQWEIHPPEGREDVLMRPGRSMYLPTGTPHAARAQESVSLHVTIGINQLTWRTLVERAIRPILDEVEPTHLPAGYLEDPAELTTGLVERLTSVARSVSALDPDAVVEDARARFLTARSPSLRGGLLDLTHEIAEHTDLRRRAGHPCVVISDGDELRVLLGDRELRVPGWLQPALDQTLGLLRDGGTFRPADLDLDAQSRVVLCRRLVREGLLEVES